MLTKKILTGLSLLATLFLSNCSSFESSFDKQMKKDFIMVPVSSNSLADMKKASTLLVSCIDFRLRDETSKLMEDIFELTDQYDEVVIPGAALALVQQDGNLAHWGKTLIDIVEIAQQLHDIKRVIFLDHRNCGAYKKILGEEALKNGDDAHKKAFSKARQIFKDKFPGIEVHTLLIGLDGKVEIFK